MSKTSEQRYKKALETWKHSRVNNKNIFSGKLLLHLTSSINKIEGINISYNRTKEIFEDEYVKNYTGDIRDLYSILNNQTLARYLNNELKKGTKINPELIKESHRLLMFGSIDNTRYSKGERAGQYKVNDYCVGRYEAGLEPKFVESAIEELCDMVKNPKDVLKFATVFHCCFENIHPFADGNGRLGRWLLNYYLILNNHPPIMIPIETREEYYKYLEAFDISQECEMMRSLFERLTIETVELYLKNDSSYLKFNPSPQSTVSITHSNTRSTTSINLLKEFEEKLSSTKNNTSSNNILNNIHKPICRNTNYKNSNSRITKYKSYLYGETKQRFTRNNTKCRNKKLLDYMDNKNTKEFKNKIQIENTTEFNSISF